LALALLIIQGIILQPIPLTQVLAGLLENRASTIALIGFDPGISEGSLTLMTTVKVSSHNLFVKDLHYAKQIIF
jgi:hypothetical protein